MQDRTERILALIKRICHHILRDGYGKSVGDEYSVSVYTELTFEDDIEFEEYFKWGVDFALDDEAELDSEYYRVAGYRDATWVKRLVFFDTFRAEAHPVKINGRDGTNINIDVRIAVEYCYGNYGMFCWPTMSEDEFMEVLANHCIGGPYDSWTFDSSDEGFWPKEAENLPNEIENED